MCTYVRLWASCRGLTQGVHPAMTEDINTHALASLLFPVFHKHLPTSLGGALCTSSSVFFLLIPLFIIPLFSLFYLEKAMAPHSSTPAWKIPRTEEPGRLQSMRSHRVGHDWSDLAAAAVFLLVCMCVLSRVSRLQLCNPMDYSPSGSSVHGISQARILEWVAIPFSRGSSQPRDQTLYLCKKIRYCWATGEALLSA